MASRKSIQGDQNEQNEVASHNRISRVIIEAGNSAFLLTCFVLVLITASILFMALVHLALLEALVVATFVGFFLCGWIILLAFTIRQVSAAKTAVAVDETLRTRATAESSVVHATDHYIVWREPDGSYQFRGSTIITENRQFLPREISPPSQQEAILTCYDQGMSGRSIEKWLSKDGKKVSYHEIQKTLNLYRPGWNTKAVVEADSGGIESDTGV